MIVAPDTGAMDRAIFYADSLGVDVGDFCKRRDFSKLVNGKNPIFEHKYIGEDVKGKNIIVIDDMIASGDSMIDVGIEEGDLLVIDRSITPQDGHIVVAFLDGEFTLKFIRVDKENPNQLYLVPANNDYPEILVTSEQQFIVWGVVTYSIKNRLKR